MAAFTVEAELADPDSTLWLYRRALRLRRELTELHGSSFDWLEAPAGCLAYRRGPNLVVTLNAGDAPVELPERRGPAGVRADPGRQAAAEHRGVAALSSTVAA